MFYYANIKLCNLLFISSWNYSLPRFPYIPTRQNLFLIPGNNSTISKLLSHTNTLKIIRQLWSTAIQLSVVCQIVKACSGLGYGPTNGPTFVCLACSNLPIFSADTDIIYRFCPLLILRFNIWDSWRACSVNGFRCLRFCKTKVSRFKESCFRHFSCYYVLVLLLYLYFEMFAGLKQMLKYLQESFG